MKRPSASKANPGVTGRKAVDAYLAAVPAEARAGLQKLRKAIGSAAPGAEEGLSYGLPTFKLGGRALVWYAAWKHHSSLYPMTAAVLRGHAAALTKYEVSKGTLRFPPGKPPSAALVKSLVKARIVILNRDAP